MDFITIIRKKLAKKLANNKTAHQERFCIKNADILKLLLIIEHKGYKLW